MQHNRSETPVYLIWVEERPSNNGRGKTVYYDAVKRSVRQEIDKPIIANDVEVEIVYCTSTKKYQRMDADNVSKPTLDALKNVAYLDDAQVRSVTSTVFNRNEPASVRGRVERMGRLFYSHHEHVIFIMLYSDSRLAESGGEQEVQFRRYLEWERDFNQMLSEIRRKSAE